MNIERYLRPIRRWTAGRKARLVFLINQGKISAQDAMRIHNISPQELAIWAIDYEEHGVKGLRTTYAQDYRNVVRHAA